jgi:membrane protein
MKSLLQETITHWNSRNASRMGAALSYYTMLSFVPLFVLLVTVVGLIFGNDVVQGAITTELASTVGRGAAQYIDTLIKSIELGGLTMTTAISSAVITIFGAIGIFSELDKDFDELWDTPKEYKKRFSWVASLVSLIRSKIVALSFIPILVVLLFGFVMFTIVFGAIESHIAFLPVFAHLVYIAQIVVPLIFGTLLFALIYRILPERTLPWRIVCLGALVTTLLFGVGNIAISAYIRLFVHTSVFGAAASLVGLLVWVYYSAQVFFVGASFTYVYAKRKGLIVAREKVQ